MFMKNTIPSVIHFCFLQNGLFKTKTDLTNQRRHRMWADGLHVPDGHEGVNVVIINHPVDDVIQGTE